MKKLLKEIRHLFQWVKWYTTSDVQLIRETYRSNGVIIPDGFYFQSKKQFSKAYQYHAVIGIEDISKIEKVIGVGIKKKSKSVELSIRSGMGRETVHLWRGSLKKAQNDLQKLISDVEALTTNEIQR